MIDLFGIGRIINFIAGKKSADTFSRNRIIKFLFHSLLYYIIILLYTERKIRLKTE